MWSERGKRFKEAVAIAGSVALRASPRPRIGRASNRLAANALGQQVWLAPCVRATPTIRNFHERIIASNGQGLGTTWPATPTLVECNAPYTRARTPAASSPLPSLSEKRSRASSLRGLSEPVLTGCAARYSSRRAYDSARCSWLGLCKRCLFAS